MRERRRWLAEALRDRLDANQRAVMAEAAELMLRLAS